MVKALYNLRARKSLSAGDLLKWTDPATGQYVTLQPNNLSWIDNATNSQQFISSPAAVNAVQADDTLTWTNGYGTGRHFRYVAGPTRLSKHLIIDSAANLPTPTVSNPYLEIVFVLTPSSGANIVVEGATWDKKTTANTAKSIAFKTAGGVALWSFTVPVAFDSAGKEVSGVMQVRKQSANLLVAVRIPKSFFDSAVYPVYIDPTLDYQVGASADDGMGRSDDSYFSAITSGLSLDYNDPHNYYSFARFPGVTIPAGATIDVAYLSVLCTTKIGSPVVTIYADDSATPTAPTTYATIAAKIRTTAHVSWTLGYNDAAFHNSGSIKTIIDELVASYSYAAGAAMQFLLDSTHTSGSNIQNIYSWDQTGNVSGPKLHIEYTPAPASLVAGFRRRRFNSLLVR
jgi:hypothetical protein